MTQTGRGSKAVIRTHAPAGNGSSVEVTGLVSEYQGITEITPDAGGVTELARARAQVKAEFDQAMERANAAD